MAIAKLVKYGRVNYATKKHPLYNAWRSLRSTQEIVDSWLEFAVFCEDVGTRPHNTDLRRLDNCCPFGPDNFYWKKRVGI
jgi:hypothetical protein